VLRRVRHVNARPPSSDNVDRTPSEGANAAMSLADSLVDLVSRLDEWRQYPKYALERRLDIFLTPFLAPYLSQRMEAPVELVAPEFPLKRPDNAQSTNVDYLLHRRGERDPRWVFLELKTDEHSLSPEQLAIYLEASRRRFSEVVDEVERGIAPRSKHRAKYERLLERVRAGGVERLGDGIEIAYLSPKRPTSDLAAPVRWFPFKDFATWKPTTHVELWEHLRPVIEILGEDAE
jgi:hypothetical protein